MKKQPVNKTTIKVGEINKFCQESESRIETINHILGKFELEGKIKVLNEVKKRGFKIVELLSILLVIQFYRIGIYNMHEKNRGQKPSEAKKNPYYDLKNNPMIDWRIVLKAIVKQFCILTQKAQDENISRVTAFIGDDTTVIKTGLKIENVSKVHDHTTNLYLFGFKILVLGWFDGITFLPVDFSIHREKGTGSKKERKNMNKAALKLKKMNEQYNAKSQELKCKKNEQKVIKERQKQTGKQLKTEFGKSQKQIAKLEVQLRRLKKQVGSHAKEYRQFQAEYKQSLMQHPAYGLKSKHRKAQFKKDRIKNSQGAERAKEVDSKKTDNLLKMLKRAVKSGIKAQYFIVDSWFFSSKMIQGVCNLSKDMHFLGMAPMRETIMYNYNGTMVDCKYLLKKYRKQSHRCRKYRSNYIQKRVEFMGQPIQLFFVKMGRTKNWKLLATTDLSLNFIKLFELYQIRWSIEVFFKESKQYLGLGKCQSQDFDAQICSTTLTLSQYILLCYYKRIHYQQKINGIFEEISYQTMEASIVAKMIIKFLELLDIVAEIIEVDPIDLYMMLMQNHKASKIIKELKLENFLDQKRAA